MITENKIRAATLKRKSLHFLLLHTWLSFNPVLTKIGMTSFPVHNLKFVFGIYQYISFTIILVSHVIFFNKIAQRLTKGLGLTDGVFLWVYVL